MKRILIVEDLVDFREAFAFALETLAASKIAVATTAQMGQLAETARLDLRL